MSKSVLLDTNALLWILESKNGKLGKEATAAIENAHSVYASSVSIFEIQIKAMLGKLKAPKNLIDTIMKSNIKFLNMNSEHAFSIDLFPDLKKHDPFDRLLLSQAKLEDVLFVTADGFLLDLKDSGVQICDARL